VGIWTQDALFESDQLPPDPDQDLESNWILQERV